MLSAVEAVVTRIHAQPLHLPRDGYSRWKDLQNFVPLSRETVRLREKEGRFPRRIHLTERTAAWRNADIHEWLKSPETYRAGDE
ncbi:UNVERIFIED_ORG: AlpA family transcriptional regulator [Burkholderia sp. CF145]